MRRTKTRLAIAAGCAVVTAAFCGAALAGNGNESAPGQEKKDAAAEMQPAPAPAAQPAPQAAQPGSEAGVKPATTTSKWTHCATGGRGTGTATCTAQAGTPAVKADVSKRYGNGTTAAQIAVGRGAPDGTVVTGPGNSQPHKVTACGEPSNRSGGVDVHAVKSYDASACQATTETTTETPVVATPVCGQAVTATESTRLVGALHGKHLHLMTNERSAHFTKHDDAKVTATTTGTALVATGGSCGTSSPAQPATGTSSSSSSDTSSSTSSVSSSSATSTTTASSTAATSNAAGSPAAQPPAQSLRSAPAQPGGGVLGAHANVPASKPAGGVLGTVGNVAGSTLPFTGFPVWVAVLLALGLIAAGFVVRRRGPARL